MKKIFLGILNILLVVMVFVYLLIPCIHEFSRGENNILGIVAYTGLSVIGFIFLIPSFVFVILGLCASPSAKMIVFLRDVFILFASLFTLLAVAVAVFSSKNEISNGMVFVPIILSVCSFILLGLSCYGVVTALIEEKFNKKQEENN